MKQISIGIWAAIGSSILSSAGIIIHAESIKLLGPLVVCCAASLCGAAIFTLYFRAAGQPFKLAEIRAHIWPLIGLSLLRSVAGALLFVYALTLTSSIKAMFFTKAEPYFVLFWCWVLKGETIKRRHFFLLALHVSAAIVLSLGHDSSIGGAQLGDLLIIFSMACSALSYLIGGDVTRKLGAKVTNAATQFMGGLLILPFALSLSPIDAWYPFSLGWGFLLLQVLMFNIAALTLWFYAIKSVESWIVSALRAIGPVIAAPLAWVAFDQRLSTVQVIAAAAVLITSALIAKEHVVSHSKSESSK